MSALSECVCLSVCVCVRACSFLSTAASLKPSCASSVPPVVDCESDASSTDQVAEYFPQIGEWV